MTHGSTPAPAAVYRLKTFGTLALQGPGDDTVLGKHGHHRRRLALLAVIAAAGDQGRSRDQLLLYFWPEETQSRARHSLDQLLYALRGSLGESLFGSTNPVRLNPDVVSSDIADFASALEHGDFERAAQEYRGPFLDGFYLEDAPEFERWVEEERARLLGKYTDALGELARKAEGARDHAAAVRWWRKLSETDPVSSKSATGLIRALMNAGDHAAALQYAERYESLVSQELGTSVGPAVAGLVAEVRAEAKTAPLAAPKAGVTAQTGLAGAALPNARSLDQPVPSAPRRRVVAYTIAAIVVALALTATAWLRGSRRNEPRPEAGSPSVAVLPLANVSGDPQDAAVVEGLTEELITALWKIGNIRVIARTSTNLLKNSNLDARRIGDSLNADYILESSFQKSASRVRVQMRLVDAKSGSARWSETYDRELKDIFAVQRDIAAAVANQLGLRLGSVASQKLRRGLTNNIAAYELYLRGLDPIHLRTDSGPRVGLALLQQAIALDSNFAAAYAAMPFRYVALISRATTLEQAREFQRLSLQAARRALALDSTLPEVHAGLGVALATGANDVAGAEAAYRRAFELGGTPRAHELLGQVLIRMGRHEEALAESQRALDEDPLSPTATANVAQALCASGRPDEGLEYLKRVADLKPPLGRTAGYMALCYGMKGMVKEAAAALSGARLTAGDPYSPMLGYFLARSGSPEARTLQAQAMERWRQTGRAAIWAVFVAAGFGDYDQAFEWLDRVNDLQTTASIMYPLFKDLQADPRFERYRQRVGLQKR